MTGVHSFVDAVDPRLIVVEQPCASSAGRPTGRVAGGSGRPGLFAASDLFAFLGGQPSPDPVWLVVGEGELQALCAHGAHDAYLRVDSSKMRAWG